MSDTTDPRCPDVDPGAGVPDPWARHGWLLAAVWLVFLGFPASSVIDKTVGQPLIRAVGLLLLVAFAVIYIIGFMHSQIGLHAGWTRRRLVSVYGGFAALVLIMALLWPIIGVEVLGVTAFLASLAAFGFPLRSAVAAVVVVTGAGVITLIVTGSMTELWPLLLLPALIGSFGLLLRRMILGDERREIMQRTLAVAAERDRVARDVHDVLGHSLTVVSLKADLAERLIDIDPDRAKGEIAAIRSLTRQSLAEIRATVAGLRITRLADEREAAAAALQDAGIIASVPDDYDIVDPAHRITIAWALREATTNVIRHSGAHRVDVRWGPTWLEVTDDGRGLRGRREGTGLTGLRERLAQVGGRLTIEDGMSGASGPGTQLRVELP